MRISKDADQLGAGGTLARVGGLTAALARLFDTRQIVLAPAGSAEPTDAGRRAPVGDLWAPLPLLSLDGWSGYRLVPQETITSIPAATDGRLATALENLGAAGRGLSAPPGRR